MGYIGAGPTRFNTADELTVTGDAEITGAITTDGMTTTADVTFGDSDKAVFGAGSDLQIYHDGTKSVIADVTGAGNFHIRGSNVLYIQSDDGGENYAVFNDNGSASLYYDNAAKLATTATGVDITGTVTSDGLTVDGTSTIDGAGGIPLTLNATGNTNLQFNEGGALRWYIRNVTGSNDFNFYGNGSSRLNIGSAGDISFYNTSGTAKLSWDASAESLGIGLTPEARLDIFGNSDVTAALKIGPNANFGHHFYDSSTNGDLVIKREVSGVQTETMRLTRSGGYVGIGATNPGYQLHLASTDPRIAITNNNAGTWFTSVGWAVANSNDYSIVQAGVAERLRIKSTGFLRCVGVYNQSAADSANVVVDSTGNIYRSTSALKYKQDIRDIEEIDISQFRPIRYKSNLSRDDQTKDHFGFIADEAHDAGYTELVSYGAVNEETGIAEVEGFRYDRMTVLLTKVVQQQQATIQEQQVTITALEARIAALETA